MVLKTLYGKSQNAVHNQVYLAMIAFCLTLLLQEHLNYKESLLTLKKHLAKFILGRYPDLKEELFRPPLRASKGRKRYDHEQQFKEIWIEVGTGKFSE